MKWHKTSDQLPTTKTGEQVQVLIWSPNWVIWFKGMFSYCVDEKDRWSVHDINDGEYQIISEIPEYWCAPTLPQLGQDGEIMRPPVDTN